MSKRFLVVGGYVTSRADGDCHFVSAHQLVDLYGVRQADCSFANDERALIGRSLTDGVIVLRPRYDGNYDLNAAICEAMEARLKGTTPR